MRYLAIDHGMKRTGLAICDADETIASPLCVLQGRKGLIFQILQIVQDQAVGAVVVGLPVNMDDSEGPQAKTAKAFARELAAQLNIPVHLQDERLSSFGADEKLQASGLSRGKKRNIQDAIAAAEILQAFLEREKL